MAKQWDNFSIERGLFCEAADDCSLAGRESESTVSRFARERSELDQRSRVPFKLKRPAVNRSTLAPGLAGLRARNHCPEPDKSFVISLRSRCTTNEVMPLYLGAINIVRRRMLALLVINYTAGSTSLSAGSSPCSGLTATYNRRE